MGEPSTVGDSDLILKVLCKSVEVTVEKADLTECTADIIVVPVDRNFSFKYGVSKQVALAAGPSFKHHVATTFASEDCGRRRLPGELRIFPGCDLKADHVMGIVSSSDPHEIKLLYEHAIRVADQKGARTVCLSSIGTGMLNIPAYFAAKSAAVVLSDLLCSSHSGLVSLQKIRFLDLSCSVVYSLANEFKKLPGCSIEHSVLTDSEPGGDEDFQIVTNDVNFGADAMDFDTDDSTEANQFFSTFYYNASEILSGGNSEPSSQRVCAVCLDDFSRIIEDNPVVELCKCKHLFHLECVKRAFESLQAQCPVCKTWYGVPRGNQPLGGTMKATLHRGYIPGFPESKGYYLISYCIPGGVQTSEHLRPGVPFSGTSRLAYLPNTPEGVLVLRLLKLAFRYRLTFTVGDSVTTGARNVVVWNNIHHKSSLHGRTFGYPDPTYLERVKEELASVGITEEFLKEFDASVKKK